MPDHSHHDSGHTVAVLDVSGVYWASEQAVVTAVLRRRPGVLDVEANPVAQTATVTFDAARTSLAQLRDWVTGCGYHRAGQSVPAHVCDPMAEPRPAPQAAGNTDDHQHSPALPADHGGHAGLTAHDGRGGLTGHLEHAGHASTAHAGHDGHAAAAPALPPHDGNGHEHGGHGAAEMMGSPHDTMRHAGHGGMSMAAMVADMRNRFLVAALFSIPILMWSKIGSDVLPAHVFRHLMPRPVNLGLGDTSDRYLRLQRSQQVRQRLLLRLVSHRNLAKVDAHQPVEQDHGVSRPQLHGPAVTRSEIVGHRSHHAQHFDSSRPGHRGKSRRLRNRSPGGLTRTWGHPPHPADHPAGVTGDDRLLASSSDVAPRRPTAGPAAAAGATTRRPSGTT